MIVRHTGGFSAIELVIVLAIILGLVGVVVPVVSQEIQDSEKAEAIADINRIATSINQYIKDTLFFPTGNQGATSFHFLYTDGKMPDNNVFDSGEGVHVDQFLVTNNFGGARWKGPYLSEIHGDPWGNAYLVNIQGFYNPGERAVILSAGPDGIVSTTTTTLAPDGDDLMLLID